MNDTHARVLKYMDHSQRGLGGLCVRAGLRALSVPYWLATKGRVGLYNCGLMMSRELDAIVISVGNVTTGGTGKTPLVIWTARHLQQRSIPTAILSRGYGPKGPAGDDTDESLLFRRHVPTVPHLVGKNRYITGQSAIDDHQAECIILDDGFQHLAIGRDLDIVLIDSLMPFGFGHLLPRGLLREPLSCLRRADVIVLTRCDLCPKDRLRDTHRRIRDVCGFRPIVESAHRPVRFYRHLTEESRPLGWVQGSKVFAFSALGNPQAFPRTLDALGAQVVHHQVFRDHHWYDEADLKALARAATDAGAEAVVTTEKDAVKIKAFPEDAPPLYVLAVDFSITQGEELLTEIIEQVVQG